MKWIDLIVISAASIVFLYYLIWVLIVIFLDFMV